MATRQPRRTTSDNIDQTKPAYLIIQKGGGLSAFCRDYDFPTSTVHSWMLSGLIPSRTRDTPEGRISYQAWIMRRSEELGHGIAPEDFIEAAIV